MKRFIAIALSLILIVSLSACGQPQSSASSPSISTSSAPSSTAPSSTPAPTSDEKLIQFVNTLSDSLVLSASWDNADKLLVDAFSSLYYRIALLELPAEQWTDDEINIPAKEFEDTIAKHFDVSTRHLRTAKNYNVAGEFYSFDRGIGSGGMFDITAVTTSGDTTVVAFTAYDLGDNPTRKGEVTVKASGDSFKALSCSVTDIPGESVPPPCT